MAYNAVHWPGQGELDFRAAAPASQLPSIPSDKAIGHRAHISLVTILQACETLGLSDDPIVVHWFHFVVNKVRAGYGLETGDPEPDAIWDRTRRNDFGAGCKAIATKVEAAATNRDADKLRQALVESLQPTQDRTRWLPLPHHQHHQPYPVQQYGLPPLAPPHHPAYAYHQPAPITRLPNPYLPRHVDVPPPPQQQDLPATTTWVGQPMLPPLGNALAYAPTGFPTSGVALPPIRANPGAFCWPDPAAQSLAK
ncbi:hypothetical protein JCM10908_003680 [Rhodotorula pacifica]|uniref:uncharacterized protein n=1 Tax=Rhodotorula pacifica TaxID=1495444 RepID=UPI0031742736